MIWTIKNEFLEVQVNDYGAELWSIKGLKTNTEYLWQGEKPYWGDRATVIFPICGRLYQGKYTYKGKTYEMIIHGFAKKMNYEVEEHTDTKIRLSFASKVTLITFVVIAILRFVITFVKVNLPLFLPISDKLASVTCP